MNVFRIFCNTKLLERTLGKSIFMSDLRTVSKSTLASEKEFVVKLKSDPDKFGNIEPVESLTEDDAKEAKLITEQPLSTQKLRTKQYADIIKSLIRNRKVKEAIDVVEVRMLQEDKVKPENYIYNLLLGACGRVGYTKKAFSLYNEMKRRGLAVTGGTYTALFNACANSPWPETDGLDRATKLRNIMVEKGYQPNDTNYNAMIKAFGRCKDYITAFTLVDEMITKGIPIKDDTINFLLQACISDKEAGFRHALLVWRKMIERKVKPSIYTYNLLLRTVRDCGMGNIEVTKQFIDLICNQKLLQDNDEIPRLSQASGSNTDLKLSNNDSSQSLRPDLLADIPNIGPIISLEEVVKPEHRLLLIGAQSGFLENMQKHNCVPDIKTFTLLLDCIPSTLAAESALLSTMKKLKIKPDVDFFNMLIKKRSLRFEYNSAKEVLHLMSKFDYLPNLITYGILALGCKDKWQAQEFIESMKEKNYSLNSEILGAMLNQACFHKNVNYVIYILELCLEENVKPNKKFMETVEEFKKVIKSKYNDKKLKKEVDKSYLLFKNRYKKWLEKIEVDETEDEHPWKQFRENSDVNYNYKPKDTARFKPKHKSRFMVKTSTKQRN